MRKLKIYFDTSVLNFYYANDSPKEMLATRKLFEQIKKGIYECYISDVVLAEVEKAEEEIKNRLKSLIVEYELKVLRVDEEVIALFEKYVEANIIPAKYENDILHIAVSVVNQLDVILSWNFEHIVKLKTKNEVNGINLLLGYRQIQIATPMEVIENED
jgi:predicted nucleic acid-binding protein